jgi:hypothetical protein
MDELMTMILFGPFYAAGVACTWFGTNYGFHMLRRVDESATKTALTETIKSALSDLTSKP